MRLIQRQISKLFWQLAQILQHHVHDVEIWRVQNQDLHENHRSQRLPEISRQLKVVDPFLFASSAIKSVVATWK